MQHLLDHIEKLRAALKPFHDKGANIKEDYLASPTMNAQMVGSSHTIGEYRAALEVYDAPIPTRSSNTRLPILLNLDDEEFRRAVRLNQKINAIKRYRVLHDSSLREASDIVQKHWDALTHAAMESRK